MRTKSNFQLLLVAMCSLSLMLSFTSYGYATTAFPDTPYIQALLEQKTKQRQLESTWEVDAQVRTTATQLSNLMRLEFQGSNRKYVISAADYALLERGIIATGFIPLNQMAADQTYKGQEGGLYGLGRNEPPAQLYQLAQNAVARTQPLDATGNPDPNGRIVLMGMGQVPVKVV